MAIYCIKIKYTKEAIKGIMKEGLGKVDAMRNLSAGITTTMMANTLEDYKVIPLYAS